MHADVELIDSFCSRHNLIWAIDCATVEPIIVGEHDAKVYCYDVANGKLALSFVPDEHPDGWSENIGKLLKARFQMIRDCICESYAAFDPMSEAQSLLALSIAGIQPVEDSEAKREKMRNVIEAARGRNQRATELKRLAKMRALRKAGVYLDKIDMEDAAGYLTASNDWMHGRIADPNS